MIKHIKKTQQHIQKHKNKSENTFIVVFSNLLLRFEHDLFPHGCTCVTPPRGHLVTAQLHRRSQRKRWSYGNHLGGLQLINARLTRYEGGRLVL